MVEESQRLGAGGTTRTVTTHYAGARRSALVYPSGRQLGFTDHPGGALDTVSDAGTGGWPAGPIAAYDYLGGRSLVRAMGNGVDLDLRDGEGGAYYDAMGRPTQWRHRDTNQTGDPVVVGFEYSYDPPGNKLMQRSFHDPLDD